MTEFEKKKTVVLLTESFPYGHGEQFVYGEIEVLATNYEVLILPKQPFGKLREIGFPGITVHPYTRTRLKDICANLRMPPIFGFLHDLICLLKGLKPNHSYSALFRLMRTHFQSSVIKLQLQKIEKNYSVSVAYSFWGDSLGLGLVRSNLRCPKVVRFHGYDLYSVRNPSGFVPARRIICRKADAILTVSHHGANYLRDQLSQYAEKVHYAPLGVKSLDDESKYLPDSCFRLLSISEVQPVKNLEVILDALSLAKEQGFCVRWTHIGGGPNLPTLRKAAVERGLETAVIFLGQLPPGSAGVRKVLREKTFDLAVNTSFSEGLPVSLQEALSFGIPIAASNVGGNTELVVQSGGFLLSPATSGTEVFQVMSDLSRLDIESIKRLREAAIACQRRSYDLVQNGEKLNQLFVKLQNSASVNANNLD